MTKQAASVLAYLAKWGADTDTNIGLALSIPASSVRRSVQELIRVGCNVTYAGPETGLYTYRERRF